MKTLKKATQKNVSLNKYYYNPGQIKKLLDSGEVWYLKESREMTGEYDYSGHSYNEYMNDSRRDLRIDLDKGDELMIILKDGFYTNILKKNNKEYFVEL